MIPGPPLLSDPLMTPLMLWPLLLAGSGYLLQPPGWFHADEPVVTADDAVLALSIDGAGARLAPARIIMRRVNGIADPVEGPDTAWWIGPEVDAPLVYLRGEGLAAGVIEQAQIGATTGMFADASGMPTSTVIRFRGADWRLASACDPSPDARSGNAPALTCHITLHGPDGAATRLVSMGGYRSTDGHVILGNDSPAALLFAGDIDRDRRLDLLLDTSDHFNIRRPTLFLSGAAEGETPLRAVASHEAVGC